jgi:hypothetical protein
MRQTIYFRFRYAPVKMGADIVGFWGWGNIHITADIAVIFLYYNFCSGYERSFLM